MKTSARLVALSLVAFGLLLSGCDSNGGDEEDSLTGSYTAVEAEGESLPAEVNRGEGECGDDDMAVDRIFVLDSGLLNLREDMSFRISLTQESYCEGSNDVDTETATASGDYDVSGNEITFVITNSSDNLENFDLEGEVQGGSNVEVDLVAEERISITFSD